MPVLELKTRKVFLPTESRTRKQIESQKKRWLLLEPPLLLKESDEIKKSNLVSLRESTWNTYWDSFVTLSEQLEKLAIEKSHSIQSKRNRADLMSPDHGLL